MAKKRATKPPPPAPPTAEQLADEILAARAGGAAASLSWLPADLLELVEGWGRERLIRWIRALQSRLDEWADRLEGGGPTSP